MKKYILNIENSIEWHLQTADGETAVAANGWRMFDVGITKATLAEWKEVLAREWDVRIELTVYAGEHLILDHHDKYKPVDGFKTTVGGALEWLLTNRRKFGFAPIKDR